MQPGVFGLPLSALWQALFQSEKVNAGIHVIVWDIRLPYALMALLVGMALGLAGAEMQTILNIRRRRRLPRRIVRGGFVLRWRLRWGSVFPVFLPPGLSRPMRSSLRFYPRYSRTVLPAGQASPHPEWCCSVLRWSFTFNALVAIMQFVADEDTLQGLVFWTMDRGPASWERLGIRRGVYC